MKPSRWGRAQGFSLIETLVAMVILSLSLGVLYQGVMGATRNARVAAEYSRAVVLAESIMTDVETLAFEEFDTSGRFDDLSWRARARSVEDESLSNPDSNTGQPLMRLDVVVSWDGQGKPREFAMTTVVQPTVNPADAAL